MNECKCGRIPPCYGSLEFAIYEEAKKVNEEWKKSLALHGKLIDKMRAKLMEGGFFDDTYHKVYGVNEQLCDLGKTILTKNDKDMEEKKTKKMTKAEAFEWLKHKKVRVVRDTCALQTKLFEIGYKWCDGTIKVMPMADILFIDDETFQFTESLSHFWNCAYEEISADDILSIEIVEEKYELEFNYDKAVELAKPLMHYLSETGHTEVISVCKEGISAIPMGTFLYKG